MVLDRVWAGKEKKHDRIRLCILPWLVILGAAGPYCASYAATLLLSYGFCMVRDHDRRADGKWDRRYVLYGLCTLLPLLLYMLSNSFAVNEHAGATGRSLGQILADHPGFPVRFLLKSFAGILVGGEELQALMESGTLTNLGVYLLGLFVVAGYLLALWLNLRLRVYEKTVFPMMLLVSGGMNHVLIFISRYIFEKEDYAWSSRYALQFQVGILGIVLTFALAFPAVAQGRRAWRAVMALFCLAILAGNGYTTYRELKKAPYREERFEQMAQQAGDFSGLTDDKLAGLYEYYKGRDKIEQAFEILKENHLNVFRDR